MGPSDRGVLFPARLPDFERRPAGPGVKDLVRWFWIARWSLGSGEVSRQHVIAFPAINLIVELGDDPGVLVAGPTSAASVRELRGEGCAVSAVLWPAAAPALIGDPSAHRDRVVRIDDVRAERLHSEVASSVFRGDISAATGAIEVFLHDRVGSPPREALLANRLVDMEGGTSSAGPTTPTTVQGLAADLGISVRTSQRLAARFVGLRPQEVLRRRRVQEAAARLREVPRTDLATVAQEEGFADQAHLCAEFRELLGFTPGGYRSEAAE